MRLSQFRSLTDTTATQNNLEWSDFVRAHCESYQVVNNKKLAAMISPAIYDATPLRSDVNVSSVSFIVLDFDNETDSPSVPSDHEDNLSEYAYAFHSTYSNKQSKPKWRLYLPLSREVSPQEFNACWHGAWALTGHDENVDQSCADLSRAYFVSSCPPYEVEHRFFGQGEGRVATPEELIEYSGRVVSSVANVSQLPVTRKNSPPQGRNDALKAQAGAAFNSGKSIEKVAWEIYEYDNEHHTPPLFQDPSEYREQHDPFKNALQFATNIYSTIQGRDPGAMQPRPTINIGADESFFIMGDDFKATPKPVKFAIKDVIPEKSLGVLFGDPGSYKSFLAADWALHIAGNEQWGGRKMRPGGVVFIANEGLYGLRLRVSAWAKWHNRDVSEYDFAITKYDVALLNEATAEQFAELVKGLPFKPELFVIDTLAGSFGGGNENAQDDMGAFISNVRRHLMRPFDAGCLLVHHTGHHDKERARGSSVLNGAVDYSYRLVKESVGGFAELACTKMKDADEPKNLFIKTEEFILGEHEGEPFGSLIVTLADDYQRPKIDIGRPAKTEKLYIETLQKLEEKYDGKVLDQTFRTTMKELGQSPAAVRKYLSKLKNEGVFVADDTQIWTAEGVTK